MKYYNTLSHHNPVSTNYDNHVIPLFGNDHCVGCLASSIFLIFFTPILTNLFYLKNHNYQFWVFPLDITFFFLWFFFIVSEGLKSYKGTTFQINLFLRNMYITVLLFIIVILPSPIIITGYRMLLLIISLIFPQTLIYCYKIKTKRDFTNKFIKLISRLSFIFAIFFMLHNIRSDIITRGLLLILAGLLFLRIRAYTSLMVENENTIQFSIFEKTLKPILIRQGLIHSNNKFNNDHYSSVKQIKSIFINLFFALIFIVGIVTIKPINIIYCKTHQTNSWLKLLISNLIICKSITSTPYVKCIKCRKMYSLSGTVPEFCSKCGTELIPEEDIVYIENDDNQSTLEQTEFGLIEIFFLGIFLLMVILVFIKNRNGDSGNSDFDENALASILGIGFTLSLLYAITTKSRRNKKDSISWCEACCIDCGSC